jgi:hypothetical protein
LKNDGTISAWGWEPPKPKEDFSKEDVARGYNNCPMDGEQPFLSTAHERRLSRKEANELGFYDW